MVNIRKMYVCLQFLIFTAVGLHIDLEYTLRNVLIAITCQCTQCSTDRTELKSNNYIQFNFSRILSSKMKIIRMRRSAAHGKKDFLELIRKAKQQKRQSGKEIQTNKKF